MMRVKEVQASSPALEPHDHVCEIADTLTNLTLTSVTKYVLYFNLLAHSIKKNY